MCRIRTVNNCKYGLPLHGWYILENGVHTFNNSRGMVQKKAYPENSVVREYTAYSSRCPNTLYVVQPKNGVRGEFEILEGIAGKGFRQEKD